MSVPPPSPQYPPYPQNPYPQGPSYASPPRQKGRRGCLIAVTIVFVLLLAGAAAATAGAIWVGNKAKDAIGTTEPCPYITDEEASAAVGTDAEATLYTGIGRALNLADIRVLPDKDSCIIQQTDETSETIPGLGRAVLYTGPDARMLYERELVKAKGVTEDRGGGVSVESERYFNKDVPGFGERAFCIKSAGLLAGVVVQDGDRLVYVGVTRFDLPPGADLSDPENAKLTTDDPACEASQELARAILAKS